MTQRKRKREKNKENEQSDEKDEKREWKETERRGKTKKFVKRNTNLRMQRGNEKDKA